MPFDENLILIDGTVDLTDTTDTPAVSTTRNTTYGCAVIDLKGTGFRGLAAVLVVPAAALAGSTLLGYIEASDEVAFTVHDTTEYLHRVAVFQILAATYATILAAETPCTCIVRFTTNKRYVRANLTVNVGYNFYKTQVLLSPYPYLDL